eukprot:m.249361 g.249361  ORF g.249361 m.249361 type:complete len:480 (+) comp19519_c0_seq1:223-1662(+)
MGKVGEKKDKKNKLRSPKKHKDKSHKVGKSHKSREKSSSQSTVRQKAHGNSDDEKLSLTIDYVGEQHEALNVAVFPNGTPVCYMDTSGNDDQSTLSFELGSNSDSFGVSTSTLTAETPRTHYTSRQGQERCRYYVGIATDDSSLQLYDAHMFAMTPRVKAAEALATTERSLLSRGDIQAAQEQLTESFGGKKQQQKVNAKERYRVDTHSISQNGSTGNTSLLHKHAYDNEGSMGSQGDVDLDRLVPPFDKTATEAHLIYPMEQLVSSSQLQSLQDHAVDFTVTSASAVDRTLADWEEDPSYKKSVLHAMYQQKRSLAPASGSHEETVLYRIVYLDILLGLFSFFAKKKFSVVKEKVSTFLQDPPEMVLDRILELFTEARSQPDREGTASVTKYFMDRKAKDLLVSHICVLFLHLNDFGTVPVAPLVADLGLPAQKVSEYFRYIGCAVSTSKTLDGSNSKVLTAKLQVPLKFPLRLGRAK